MRSTDRAAGLTTTASSSCVEAGPCYTYKLRLAQSGARLRIGIDIPQRRDTYRITVVAPHGVSTQKSTSNTFNAEVFVPKPDAGEWTIVVAPLSAEHSTFDLRAKLETSESDNLGYAYVRVIGDYAQLLETGLGSDPWDPHKIVSRFSP